MDWQIRRTHFNYLQQERGIYAMAMSTCLSVRVFVWRLVAWRSGRTSVSDRRTFPVLRSTYSWRVTTYVVNRPL